jgi:hypothetical protein
VAGVVAAFVLIGIVVESGRRIATSDSPDHTATLIQGYLEPVSFALPLLLGLLALWWRSRTSVEVDSLVLAAAAADRLQQETHTWWLREAARRGILEPDPVEITWQWAADVGSSPHDVMSPAPAGAGVPPLGALTEPGPAGAAQPERRVIAESGSITDLHDSIYAVLPQGRLVLVGERGAGKTGAMILLLLAALEHRQAVQAADRRMVPIPVWLTLSQWDPHVASLKQWVLSTLQRDHRYLQAPQYGTDAPSALFRERCLALFLDGLDEMPASARTRAIQRLEREAPGLRVVLTSRRTEFAETQAQWRFQKAAVVELQPVEPDAVVKYLLHDQGVERRHLWERVTGALSTDSGSVVRRTLNNALTLSLARATYRRGDPSELLDSSRFPTVQAMKQHLLDAFLGTAYDPATATSRSRAWPSSKARRWLEFLAHSAEHSQSPTGDIAWWQLRDRAPRALPGVAVGLVAAVAGALTLPYPLDLGIGLSASILIAALVGRWTAGEYDLAKGAAGGILGGLAAAATCLAIFGTGVDNYLIINIMPAGLAFGIAVAPFGRFMPAFLGAAGGGMIAMVSRYSQVFGEVGAITGPVVDLLNGLAFGVTAGVAATRVRRSTPSDGLSLSRVSLLAGLACGFGPGLVAWIGSGPLPGILVGLFATVSGGLAAGLAQARAVDTARTATPRVALAKDRLTFVQAFLTLGLAVGIAVGLSTTISPPEPGAPPNGIAIGVPLGLADFIGVGLAFAFLQASWGQYTLARIWLATTGKIPWRLIAFLEDAHDQRHVLRQVGPAYEFRHAELRHRLAVRWIDSRKKQAAGAVPQSADAGDVGVSAERQALP